MFKSDSDIEKLLESDNNSVRVAIIGNGQDDRADRTPKSEKRERLTLDEKANIAMLASVIGVKPASQMLGKTLGVVGRIASGEDAQGNPAPELITKIEDKKNLIQRRALDRAAEFLEMLGVDSSENLKIASAAEKVVNVYDKLSPKSDKPLLQAQIVFYAPRILETKDYNIIEVTPQEG